MVVLIAYLFLVILQRQTPTIERFAHFVMTKSTTVLDLMDQNDWMDLHLGTHCNDLEQDTWKQLSGLYQNLRLKGGGASSWGYA